MLQLTRTIVQLVIWHINKAENVKDEDEGEGDTRIHIQFRFVFMFYFMYEILYSSNLCIINGKIIFLHAKMHALYGDCAGCSFKYSIRVRYAPQCH